MCGGLPSGNTLGVTVVKDTRDEPAPGEGEEPSP